MLKLKLNDLIQKQIKAGLQTGVQVSVVHKGTPIISEAYGRFDNKIVTEKTIFPVLAMRHYIESIFMSQLSKEYSFSCTEPIKNYWPELR